MEGTMDETEGVRGEVWMKADFKNGREERKMWQKGNKTEKHGEEGQRATESQREKRGA